MGKTKKTVRWQREKSPQPKVVNFTDSRPYAVSWEYGFIGSLLCFKLEVGRNYAVLHNTDMEGKLSKKIARFTVSSKPIVEAINKAKEEAEKIVS